jgi:site-specific DNA-adenine methylase
METEKTAWTTFKAACPNFFGNVKADNYKELVEDLLNAYQTMRCNIALKIHILHSHLKFFPPNQRAVSDEHGERYRQDISIVEKKLAAKSSRNMLVEYCWNLIKRCLLPVTNE